MASRRGSKDKGREASETERAPPRASIETTKAQRRAVLDVDALKARHRRSRLRGKKGVRYEADLLAWMLEDNARSFRRRFKHRISNASDDVIDMAAKLVADVFYALTLNHPEALAHTKEVFEFSYNLRDMEGRVTRALHVLSTELQAERIGASPEQVLWLRFLLRPIDEHFVGLDIEESHAVLAKADLTGAGGRGRLGIASVLAALAQQCGAFGDGISKDKLHRLIQDAESDE